MISVTQPDIVKLDKQTREICNQHGGFHSGIAFISPFRWGETLFSLLVHLVGWRCCIVSITCRHREVRHRRKWMGEDKSEFGSREAWTPLSRLFDTSDVLWSDRVTGTSILYAPMPRKWSSRSYFAQVESIAKSSNIPGIISCSRSSRVPRLAGGDGDRFFRLVEVFTTLFARPGQHSIDYTLVYWPLHGQQV